MLAWKLAVCAVLLGIAGAGAFGTANQASPLIPRTWADGEIKAFELPLAVPEHSPRHVSEAFYYQVPIRPLYRSYPVYHPSREPVGYREWLRRQEPVVVFDEEALPPPEGWEAAGALVFQAPIDFDRPIIRQKHVDDLAWYIRNDVPLAADGTVPFVRWVVREQGKPEIGNLSCAMCHVRVMPDGNVIQGAQGNFPFDRVIADDLEGLPPGVLRAVTIELVGAPWDAAGIQRLETMPEAEIAAALRAVPAGTLVRQGTSLFSPARIPDLIGIRDRRYLDATGFVRHRSIGDLMRYAATNQGFDMIARYGDWWPTGDHRTPPVPGEHVFNGTDARYSDAQLYALARFLYSLEPPPNPNPMNELATRGRRVFEAEDCGSCHTPPLYTNNRLAPVPGFDVPVEHRRRFDVTSARIGTDPTLTLRTRRGTGYYKVPSLKGLWYRSPLGHDGSVATLEDWFDPARRRTDYVPTGFRGHDGQTRAVTGHPFGFDLTPEEKRALIAFLNTL